MDEKAHSSKIIKSFEINRTTSSQSYRSHSSVIDSRGSQIGSNSKRPRISMASEQVQSDSHSSFSSPNVEEVPDNQSNNSSILNRVTNTVSGLFSNVSWSEWLKGSSSPLGNENESSFSDNKAALELPRQDKLPLNQLYPEEGIAGVNLDMASGSSLQGSGDKSDISMKLNISSFKDQSVISSTPSLSLYNKKRRATEEYLCDSIISKPSTSDFCREVLPPQENCINLLKMSFPESNSENYNGSISTFPSSRKRLRENLEEDDTVCDNSYQNVSKKRPLQQTQLLSEETEVPTSIKRKRPRFSISTYGSPLLSKQAEEEEPSFSIFYPGKIMFGGASNHQKKKNRIIPRKICPRTPATNSANVDDHSDGGLSSAARRILDCIDKISTPLSDSKRAFQFNNPRDYSFNNTTFVADFHKHKPSSKAGLDVQSPPVTKLLTPSKVKITRNFSSLFEAKTADNSAKQHETKASNATTSKESNGHSKASPFKFTSPAFGASTQKEMLTPKTNQFTNVKSFVNKTSSSSVAEFDKKIVNNSVPTTTSFDERLKSAMSKFAPKKFEVKPLTTNKDSNVEFTFKNSDTDNGIQYNFSKPGVVSGLMGEEIIPECTVEFKFSQPINEVESTANKDIQPLKFSFKKDAGSWECDSCLLQNKSEAESCVACLSSKPVKASSQVEPQPKINPFKKEVGSWDCDTCLLRNKGDVEKCVACLSSKPSQSSKSSFNIDPQPQINLFRKESGSWDCNSCLLRNKNEDEKCVACSASKNSNSTSKPVIEGFKGNWGDSFKSSKGAWDCEMCLLQNKESASNCAACETPKPVSGQKKSVSSVFSGMATSASCWGDPFKPVDESWLCETCKMQNTLSTVACAGCKTPKNNQKNEVDGSNNKSLNYSFGISSKENFKDSLREKLKQDSQKDIEINWLCPECLTSNKNTDLKCSSCSCSKSTFNDPLKSKSTPLPLTGFGSQFSKSKDEWECDTCLIRNKSTAQKCVSCATPKIGATHSTIVSEVMTGNFKFGVNASQAKSEAISSFNFGTSSKPLDVNKLSTFKLGANPEPAKEATSSIFKFGGNDSKPAETETPKISFLPAEKKDTPFKQNSSADKDIIPPTTSKFVFGTPLPSTTLTIPTISITSASTDTSFSLKTPIVAAETKKNDNPITSEEIKTKPLFQFGSTALPNTQTEAKKLEFPKINSPTTTQSDSLTQLPKVNPSTFSFFGNKATPTSQGTFGSSDSNTSNKGFSFDKKEKNTPSISFNFGNVDASKTSTASFNFGTVDSKPNPPVFSFGGGESNKPSTSLFQFGSGAPTSSVISFGQQQSGNAFGAPVVQPAKAASAPLHLSIPENSNPFNVLGASSAMPGEPPKRVIKKASRRLRQ